MTFQTFIKNVGIGSKGYALINKSSKKKSVFISGISIDYTHVHLRITKIINNKLKHIKIGKERESISSIKKIAYDLQKKNIQRIFVCGGGAIIDCSKYIYDEIIKINDDFVELYFIPSKVGSGTESSITSILNTKKGKIINTKNNINIKGAIYDLELLKKNNNQDFLLGSLDGICHCVESLTSFNSNAFLKFYSTSSINFFLKKTTNHTINSKIKYNKDDLINFCILSFNGGIAQNNSGGGVCHALAHAAEKMTGLSHSLCISYFLLPTLKYNKLENKSIFKDVDKHIFKFIQNVNSKIYTNELKKIDEIINKKNKYEQLISMAKNDICWKLFNKKINTDLLKKNILS